MRQAGRYLPEYRRLRERYTLLEICGNPELAAEVTLQPIRRFDLDAAIIFADILLPLKGMGLDFRFARGRGSRHFPTDSEPRSGPGAPHHGSAAAPVPRDGCAPPGAGRSWTLDWP